ncbi:MAG: twin-arginine translocation signal domain-containing protein [Planctomycetota bacterium]
MTNLPHPVTSRRDFLRATASAALALPLLGNDSPRPASAPFARGSFGRGNGELATRHVVLIAFAGGVRTKDVIEQKENAPNLHRIAQNGILHPGLRCANVGHYGAALSMFTGNVEALGIRDDGRGRNPTVFEYLRKDRGFGPGDLWLSTSNGAQGKLFAHSDHPDYGAAFAANVLDGEGIFNVEFKKVLDTFGRPRADGEKEALLLDELNAALDGSALQTLQGGKVSAEHVRRIEKFILDELTGSSTNLTGPGSGDAKAIRVGANILRTFRPRVLGITLQNADIAHGSYNGYVEVIRRNDQEIGKLWDAVQQDPELKDSTTLLVCPEFGRDKDLNERNGLDHGDGSDCLQKVFLVGAGPDFARGKTLKNDGQTLDLCPTVLTLCGQKPGRMISGKVLDGAFA